MPRGDNCGALQVVARIAKSPFIHKTESKTKSNLFKAKRAAHGLAFFLDQASSGFDLVGDRPRALPETENLPALAACRAARTPIHDVQGPFYENTRQYYLARYLVTGVVIFTVVLVSACDFLFGRLLFLFFQLLLDHLFLRFMCRPGFLMLIGLLLCHKSLLVSWDGVESSLNRPSQNTLDAPRAPCASQHWGAAAEFPKCCGAQSSRNRKIVPYQIDEIVNDASILI